MKRIVSGIMFTLLLVGMLTLKFDVEPVEPSGSEVLFFDDFDDGVADDWSENLGSWSVVDEEYFTSVGIANGITTVDDLALANCIIETKLRFTDSVGFRAGIVFRYSDNEHFYAFEISNEYDVAWMSIYTPEHPLYGYKTDHMSVPISISPNVNYTVGVEVMGNTFTGYVDGQEIISWTDGNYTSEKVGLHAHRADVFFDNFTVLRYSPIIVPDDYPTIQEAINNANEGDTIFVRNGTYYEHVVVNKTVSLIGEDKNTTIVDGNGTDTGILITENQVTLQEFTIRFCEVGIKVESNDNVISSNLVSSNGYDETELLTDQEIYQDYVSPLHRWYLHNMIEGSYTSYFNITDHTPAISVQALGQEDVNQLGVGLFYDKNNDNEPQLKEYVGYMDAKEQNVHVFLVNPYVGQYIIKVLGWEVPGEPGHFDLKITRYTGYGIEFLSSNNNTITENLVTHNPVGLYLYDSHNSTIQSNDAVDNVGGIVLSQSTRCVISNNNASQNEFGAGLYPFGTGMTFWSVHDSYIYENDASSSMFGMWLINSSDNEVIDNDVISNLGWSLLIYYSDDNTFQYNNISLTGDGVRMMFSNRNNFTENHFESNGHSGIFLWQNNTDNSITKNRFYSNQHGVELKLWCNNNTINDNDIEYNEKNGILIIESTGNLIMRNYVFLNARGIISYDSFDNKIYHNNIIFSWEEQGADFNSVNIWDDGYPSGGNYWSDYTERYPDVEDLFSGPYQNETGSDGVGDTPYVIDENNEDNYPLMKPYPWNSHDVGIKNVVTSKNIVGQGFNLQINVSIFNYGNNTGTFNITAYANTTAIAHKSVTLAARNSTTLTFTWNTTGHTKGKYTISAHATHIPNETDTADNTLTDGWVIVTIPGDLDCDCHVFLYDLTILGTAWDSYPGDPNWCADADIDGDCHVFLYDLTILGSRWDVKDC